MKKLLFLPLNYHLHPNPDLFFGLSHHFGVWDETNPPYDYDYIFMQCGALHPIALSKIKGNAKVIIWTGDARAELMDNVTQYKGISDLCLLAVGIGQKGMYEAAMGCPVDYLQQGVFNSFFLDPQKMESGKSVFIGNNYDQFEGAIERGELCRELSKYHDFEVIGNGWDIYESIIVVNTVSGSSNGTFKPYNNTRSIPYAESAKIYNEAYISISHACFNDIEGYYSNRTIDIMASGGCCLQRWFPGIENYFTDGYECVVYRTNEEAIEKIQYLYDRPEIRNMIANNGHNTAKQKHTFDVRAREVKQLIEKYSL